jgi:hypothetical protein
MFNALNGTETTDTEPVIIPDLVIIPKAPQETTYTKTEVDTILTQKANDETTYNKDEIDSLFIANDEATYDKTQVDSLLDAKEPSFIAVAPLLKTTNSTTGNIELKLSSALTDQIDLKLDESQVQTMLETSIDTRLAGYQPKLISNSTDGRNLLRPDGITMLAIEEDQFIKITPTFSILNNVPTNFRLMIGLTNDFANQVLNATNNITTLQTQILNIQSPFWCAGMVDGNNLNKLASKGRYGYSVTRAAGYPVGVYTITMDTAYASASYVLTSTMQFNGFSKVWETQPPTANTFSIVTQSVTGGIVNGSFHFTMVA